MARMTHLVLPQMIQRKRGVIINIGSVGLFKTIFDKLRNYLFFVFRPTQD